jgi:hypothetical protein
MTYKEMDTGSLLITRLSLQQAFGFGLRSSSIFSFLLWVSKINKRVAKAILPAKKIFIVCRFRVMGNSRLAWASSFMTRYDLQYYGGQQRNGHSPTCRRDIQASKSIPNMAGFFSCLAQNVLSVHCVKRYFGARLYEYSTRDLSHIFYCFALVHRSMQNTR